MKKFALVALTLAAPLFLWQGARADDEDPFAAGEDALAVNESDGSSSLRAKLKLTKMEDDMIMVEVASVDDSKFPNCVMQVKVLKDAAKKEKALKLIGRGKKYNFVPEYKLTPCNCKKKCTKKEHGVIDLTSDVTQSNLGACFYPPKTKLVIKVGDVDTKAKVFKATAIYLKD